MLIFKVNSYRCYLKPVEYEMGGIVEFGNLKVESALVEIICNDNQLATEFDLPILKHKIRKLLISIIDEQNK